MKVNLLKSCALHTLFHHFLDGLLRILINKRFKNAHVDESIKLTPVIPDSMGQGKTDYFQVKLPENHFALIDFYSFGVDWIPAAPPKVL